MPYTLKTQQIAVKDPDTGIYSGVDILAEQTTEGLLTEIVATGNEVKTDVAAQMATERSDFNTYVTTKEAELDQYKSTTEMNINTYVTNKNQEIATMIAEADEDVSDLEDRKQDVATAVAGMLDKGVDNSLSTANIPAESKAVGDLFETIVEGKSTQPNDKWNRLWIKPSSNDVEIPTMDDLDELNRQISDTESAINGKQDAPATAGTPGQVLGLDSNLTPVWVGGLNSCAMVVQNLYAIDPENHSILINKGGQYENVLTPRDFREVGFLKIYRGNVEISKWVYNKATNEIEILNTFDDLRINAIAHNKKIDKYVDLCLFAGQSNMSGRGDASQSTVCPVGEGYWWHNNALEPLIDPVGNESASTGTMIPGVCKSYFDTTGIPIVACVYAIGGTSISQWIGSAGLVTNCVSIVNAAKTYLQTNGYTIGKIMMLWNQGENDAADRTTKANYISMFNELCATLSSEANIEDFFIVKIGQHKQGTTDTTVIRSALEELGEDYKNYIVASDKFSNAQSLMADGWHFTQAGLNMVGQDSGMNMGYYRLTGIKPLHPEYCFADYIDQNVQSYGLIDLTGWAYTKSTDGIELNKYTGTVKEVDIHKIVLNDEYIINVSINNNNPNLTSVFSGNTSLEEVNIDSNVILKEGGNVRGRYQYLFDGCTALKKVISLPNITNLSDAEMYRNANYMYRGCTNVTQIVFKEGMTNMSQICLSCHSLENIPEIPSTATNLSSAFNGTGLADAPIIKHLPSIPNSVTTIDSICQYVQTLESIGTIGSGVTTMRQAFRYNEGLRGIIRIESENVSAMANAFNSLAIPNITFQVPANSTTYTTLMATYPSANVETF